MPRRKWPGCEIEDEPQPICWKCCCCSNLNGCIIIATLFGLARIVSAIHIWRIFGDDKLYSIKEALRDSIGNDYKGIMAAYIFIAIEVYLGLSFITDILLLIGSIKKILGLLVPWMIFSGIGVAMNIIGLFLLNASIFAIFSTLITLTLIIWAIIVVAAGMKEIDRQRESDPQNNTAMVELRPIQSLNLDRPIRYDEVDTQREPRPVPLSGGVFVNRYGMTHADSDEDLILKHLM